MSKNKLRPDYRKLYPNIHLSDEILTFLKKSDMRMEYEDFHRKRKRIRKDKNGKTIELPCLEHSYEVLLEAGYPFLSNSPSPEQELLAAIETEELRHALSKLDEDELAIIQALFWDGRTIRDYAKEKGISKSAADRLQRRSLGKLKIILKN